MRAMSMPLPYVKMTSFNVSLAFFLLNVGSSSNIQINMIHNNLLYAFCPFVVLFAICNLQF